MVPDGSCQIYLSSFANRHAVHGPGGWPRIGVLGDSTTPEQDNFNADYGVMTKYLNDQIRGWAAQSATDSLKIMDFAALAKTHRAIDPDPWFRETDPIHLNDVGKQKYVEALTTAAQLC